MVIYWFMEHRTHPVAPYADLIADYAELEEGHRRFAEGAVDEMFTEDEARAVLAWLKEHRRGVHVIEPTPMPIKGRTDSGAGVMGFGAIPCGGLQDSISPETDLPFDIRGYYDLSDCERVVPLAVPIAAIARIVDYLYEDEEKHFRESRSEDGTHIFNDVRVVRDWLEQAKE